MKYTNRHPALRAVGLLLLILALLATAACTPTSTPSPILGQLQAEWAPSPLCLKQPVSPLNARV